MPNNETKWNEGKRFSHLYVIAFSVATNNAAADVTADELLAGLNRRLVDCRNTGEIHEAVGMPDATDDYGQD